LCDDILILVGLHHVQIHRNNIPDLNLQASILGQEDFTRGQWGCSWWGMLVSSKLQMSALNLCRIYDWHLPLYHWC